MSIFEPNNSGTVAFTNGSTAITGVGTTFMSYRAGSVISVPGLGSMQLAADPVSDTAAVGQVDWQGASTGAKPFQYEPRNEQATFSQKLTALLEELSNGNHQALAGLEGLASHVLMFSGPGTMTTLSKSELVSGVDVDKRVETLPERNAFDVQPEGFSIYVHDIGDGRAATYFREGATPGGWSVPGYVTGPIGPLPEVTVGTQTTGAPGTSVIITPTPTVDGVELDFTIPAGEGFSFEGDYDAGAAYAKGDVAQRYGSSWIATQATTGNAPPTLPTTSNAYWQLLARKGTDGTGTGDVIGPAAAVNNRLASFDGTTGEAIKDSGFLVQANTMDVSPEALLRFGAFGLGTVHNLTAPNLATVRPAGRYFCNSPTNGPGGNGWLDVFDLAPDYAYHRFTDLSGIVFDNVLAAGVWRAWQRTTLEIGSNSAGRYVRDYKTRMQWCFGRVATRAVNINSTGTVNGTYFSAMLTHTYPAAFASSPEVAVTPVQGNLNWIGAASIPTTTAATYYLMAPSPETARPCSESIFAMGLF